MEVLYMGLLEIDNVIHSDILNLIINHLARIVLQAKLFSIQECLDDTLAGSTLSTQLSDKALLGDIEGGLTGWHIVYDIAEHVDTIA